MFCPTITSKGHEPAPLEVLIGKLKAQSEHGHMRAAYEAKVFDDSGTCVLFASIYVISSPEFTTRLSSDTETASHI
jgi:hypothetical protein